MRDDARTERELLEQVVPASTIVRRYLPLDRFLSVLESHAFWFSRPFKFNDEWEGLFPPSYIRRTRRYAQDNDLPFEEIDRDLRKRLLQHRFAHFVNCWHMSEHESDAMWKLYGLVPKGIAIQSTVGDVNECLGPDMHGPVIYYDPSHDIRSPTMFGPYDILFKRQAFSWEQEYRFWFDDDELFERIEAGEEIDQETLSAGRFAQISDMQRLFKKIVVGPGSSDEFIDQLKSECEIHKKRWLWNIIERSYSDRMWDSFTA